MDFEKKEKKNTDSTKYKSKAVAGLEEKAVMFHFLKGLRK